jgi:hypothetical protein
MGVDGCFFEALQQAAHAQMGLVDEGGATAMRPMGEQTLINISAWKDAKSLHKTFLQPNA